MPNFKPWSLHLWLPWSTLKPQLSGQNTCCVVNAKTKRLAKLGCKTKLILVPCYYSKFSTFCSKWNKLFPEKEKNCPFRPNFHQTLPYRPYCKTCYLLITTLLLLLLNNILTTSQSQFFYTSQSQQFCCLTKILRHPNQIFQIKIKCKNLKSQHYNC